MEGPAAIVCTVNGETESYEAEIRKIDRHNRDHKNFVLQITDERLLAKTNGILQGMSGSPGYSEWSAGRSCHPCLC